MLTVCEGVSDVHVDAPANTVTVLPNPARTGKAPRTAELLQHLEDIGIGLTFVVGESSNSDIDNGKMDDIDILDDGGNPLPASDLSDSSSANGFAERGVIQRGKDITPSAPFEGTEKIAPLAMPVRAIPITLAVEGMMCQNNCGSTIRKALESVSGVSRAEAMFSKKKARVWGACRLSGDALVAAVEGVGFEATALPDFVVEVEGMMCQKNCGSTAKAALDALPGVTRAEVSFADGVARVWGGDVTADALVDALEAVGFGAQIAPSVVLDVEGMMCQKNCGTTVRKALEGVPGVTRAEASFAQKRARVWVDASTRLGVTNTQDLVNALEDVGFEAGVAPVAVLNVEGMMCQKSCGTTVRGALEAVPGVSRVEVSYADKRATVWCGDAGKASVHIQDLIDAVENVGFDARVAAAFETAANGTKEASKTKNPSSSLMTDHVSLSTNGSAAKPTGHKDGHSSSSSSQSEAGLAARGGKKGSRRRYKSGAAAPVGFDGKGGGVGNTGNAPLSIGVFSVEGMSCAACVGNVERFVGALNGVGSVRVALLAGQVRRERLTMIDGAVLLVALPLRVPLETLLPSFHRRDASARSDRRCGRRICMKDRFSCLPGLRWEI